MKKVIVALISLLLLATVVSAGGNTKHFRIGLAEKDPATWDVIEDKGWLRGVSTEIRTTYGTGKIRPTRTYYRDTLSYSLKNLPVDTEYTLIYYGKVGLNDVWPHATCLMSDTSDRRGRMRGRTTGEGLFRYMFDDGLEQKFWMVPSTDVDCVLGTMTAWNPQNILFETNTV